MSRIMKRRAVVLFAIAALAAVTFAAPPATPRAIPGITAKDAFPQACVSCHMKVPDGDMRLSAMLSKLPKKHPAINAKDIPASCRKWHAAASKKIPPLAPLLHRIHLGKDKGLFLSKFQGECTHCHKLDRKTGVWSMPTGAEK
jgi:hypothetical protein